MAWDRQAVLGWEEQKLYGSVSESQKSETSSCNVQVAIFYEIQGGKIL
jgi:hypothetical protein